MNNYIELKKPTYDGHKWLPPKAVKIEYTIYGEKIEKPIFHMTDAYAAYLKKKDAYETEMEFQKLKEKVLYQQKTYGEVDEVDANRFYQLLRLRQDVVRKDNGNLSIIPHL